jgi:histone acetyltransferase (RNA polymerase elongator complex component)
LKHSRFPSFSPKTSSGKTYIVPVFIPHAGCPHCCTFCNQQIITGSSPNLPASDKIVSHIQTFLDYRSAPASRIQISFYGGNFLGMETEEMLRLLRIGRQFIREGKVQSLRFSTRPDTITPHTLSLIQSFPVSTVEIGAQSMDDRVLRFSRRGHSAADTENAVRMLRAEDYEIGLQMMPGLPGESPDSSRESGRRIAALSPDFVRIYPTVVLKNSLLAKWYREGKYSPLSLAEAVERSKELYCMFRERQIPVIRMGLQASEDLSTDAAVLAGPWHPAFGFLVRSQIYLEKALHLISSLSSDDTDWKNKEICLRVHPRRISEMRGLKNRNTGIIRGKYSPRSLRILGDQNTADGEIRLHFEELPEG